MDLLATAEQEAIVTATADVMRGEWPVSRIHRPQSHLVSPDRRKKIAEWGWFGMGLPEESGGVGLSVVEEMLAMVEIGRHLGPTTVLHGALAARVAAASADASLARRILAGVQGVALFVPAGPVSAAEGRANLQGHLYDFDDANVAICLALDEVYLLDFEGQAIDRQACWDRSIAMARCDGKNVPVLARQDATALRGAAELLTGAMLLGVAESVRDMIVEYAKIRQTFGKPIGANQAVRHPCADMAARCEMARSQLCFAAICLRDGLDGAAVQASAARVISQQAALKNVDSNIQLHGGIGVTDEHDAHLFLKRAHVLASWYGSSKVILQRILTAAVPAL